MINETFILLRYLLFYLFFYHKKQKSPLPPCPRYCTSTHHPALSALEVCAVGLGALNPLPNKFRAHHFHILRFGVGTDSVSLFFLLLSLSRYGEDGRLHLLGLHVFLLFQRRDVGVRRRFGFAFELDFRNLYKDLEILIFS